MALPTSTQETPPVERGLPPIGEDPDECVYITSPPASMSNMDAEDNKNNNTTGHSQERDDCAPDDDGAAQTSTGNTSAMSSSSGRMRRVAPTPAPQHRDANTPMQVAIESRRVSMTSSISDSGHPSVSPEDASDTGSFRASLASAAAPPPPNDLLNNTKTNATANAAPANANTDNSSTGLSKRQPGVVSVPRSSDPGLRKNKAASINGYQSPVFDRVGDPRTSSAVSYENKNKASGSSTSSKTEKSRPGATRSMTSGDLDDMISRKARARDSSTSAHVIESLSVVSTFDKKNAAKSSATSCTASVASASSSHMTGAELDSRITRKTEMSMNMQFQTQTTRFSAASSKGSASLPSSSKSNKDKHDSFALPNAPLHLDNFEGQILMKQHMANASVESATREANQQRTSLDRLERTLLRKQHGNPVSASIHDGRTDNDEMGTYASTSQGGLRSGSHGFGVDSETPPRRLTFGEDSMTAFSNLRIASRHFSGLIDADVEVAKHDAALDNEKCLLPRERKSLTIGMCIVLAIGSICVGLTFAIQSSTRSPTIIPIDSPPPTQSPSKNDRIGILEDIKEQLSKVSTIEDLENQQSPQYKALEWIANEDRLELDPHSDNLIQRYALMVLYFSLEGGRSELFWAPCPWGSSCHECDWSFVRCSDNILEGPSGIDASSSSLEEKSCQCTQFHGHVTELRLDSKRLKRSLPPEIRLLENLRLLDVGSNFLNGSIPEQIYELESLEVLNLRQNTLQGMLDSRIGDLANLRELDLGENKLSGTIPPTIQNLVDLRKLALEGNDLKGPVLNYLVGMQNIEVISLYRNDLDGTIPKAIGDLRILEELNLHDTKFTGRLPTELGKMKSLQMIDLSECSLTGTIPTEVGNLIELKHIDLAVNDFSGVIPSEIGNLNKLEIIYISHNERMTGKLPSELGNLLSLEAFLGPSCKFTGTIPTTFGQLEELVDLDLTWNDLYGKVPPEFQNLKSIKYLYIEGNNLSGSIPQTLCERAEIRADITVKCSCC